MKTFQFNDKEIDLIRHALSLLERDFKFNYVIYARNGLNENLSICVESLSEIGFLFNKLKF